MIGTTGDIGWRKKLLRYSINTNREGEKTMKYSTEVIKAARVVMDALPSVLTFPVAECGARILPEDLVRAAMALPEARKEKGPPASALMELWNKKADDRLARCLKLTSARRKHAAARLAEFPARGDWERFLDAINHNPWALGVTPSKGYENWMADFDWFIRPGSILRFLEGKFHGGGSVQKSVRDQHSEDIDNRS